MVYASVEKRRNQSSKKFLEVDGSVLTDDAFEKRYFYFGGRPRMIFAQKKACSDFLWELENALKDLPFEKLIKSLSEDSIDIDQSKGKGYSMIFVYDTTLIPIEMTGSKYSMENSKTSLGSARIRYRIALLYWKQIMDILNPKSLQ